MIKTGAVANIKTGPTKIDLGTVKIQLVAVK